MARHAQEETQSRQPYQIASTVTFVVLSIAAVALRIWVRRWVINALGSDDILMMIALLSFLIYNTALMEIVASGGGTHIRSFANLKVGLNWTIINEIFYLVTQIFLKLSLGIFFLRVFVQKTPRRIIKATMIFTTIINTYHVFFVVFQCGDPRKFAIHIVRNECVSQKVAVGLGYEQSAVSTVSDFIFAILPVFLLRDAKMDLRSKISAMLILSLGAFGSICSIVRFLYVENLGFREDFFWSAVNLSIWSTTELGTGIVAGSLATLRPLLKRIIRSTRGRVTHHPKSTKNIKLTSKSSRDIESGPGHSMHSIFHPWELDGETVTGTYTASCTGGGSCGGGGGGTTTSTTSGGAGDSIDRKSPVVSRTRNSEVLTATELNARTAIWPFPEEGIAKVVDVEVSVSRSPGPDSPRQSRRAEEGGGLWGERIEDKIRRPERARSNNNGGGGGGDHSRTSTPEWERLPDLLLMDENSGRRSREGSQGALLGPPPPSRSTPK